MTNETPSDYFARKLLERGEDYKKEYRSVHNRDKETKHRIVEGWFKCELIDFFKRVN